MKKSLLFVSAGIVLISATAAFAQDRDTLVRKDRANLVEDESWIYNDLEKGMFVARRENKPLLVIFRCIPCDACALFDEQVVHRDPKIRRVMDQFICVRIPQGNAMNLAQFQFDYDLSFTAFTMNPDGTIYGRFGTRSSRKESEKDISLEGFSAALEAALEIHKDYPNNRALLAGKQPVAVAIQRPEDYPSLRGKYKDSIDYEGKTAQSCLHCHQIRDAERAMYRAEGIDLPEKVLFPHPMPQVAGFALDPKTPNTVAAVASGSPAEKAGWRAGDALLTLAGQPIFSIADVQWVLHNAGPSETLSARVLRGGQEQNLSIALPAGWRASSDISWRTTTWDLRRMAFGGMVLEEMSDAERAAAGLSDSSLALRVQHVGMYGNHAVAKNAGVQKGDIVVAYAGMTDRASESGLLAHVLRTVRPGQKVDAGLLRNGRRLNVQIGVQ